MRVIIVLLVLFLSNKITAQETRFNTFSIEIGGGVHVPFAPSNEIKRLDYISLKQFQVSGRYMFNEKFGLKGQYAYHSFEDRENSQLGTELHKATLEAVYNLAKAFDLHYTIQENFTFLAHAGLGLSVFSPKDGLSLSYDYIGNIQFGLTPLVKISNSVALYLDGTFVVNINQNFLYSGESSKATIGAFPTANIGFVFYLGEKRYHADWY